MKGENVEPIDASAENAEIKTFQVTLQCVANCNHIFNSESNFYIDNAIHTECVTNLDL